MSVCGGEEDHKHSLDRFRGHSLVFTRRREGDIDFKSVGKPANGVDVAIKYWAMELVNGELDPCSAGHQNRCTTETMRRQARIPDGVPLPQSTTQ